MSILGLSGQVAIVTGAGSGIGRATGRLLGARGVKVVVNDPAEPEVVSEEIRAAGGEAIAERTAVGTHEAGRRIVAAAVAAFGRVDILINNAGIARPGTFGALPDEEIDQVIAVNLMGPFTLMRAVWPHMALQGYGRIVNLGSSAALGSGISGPYAVSKAGLIGLTKDAGIAGKPLGILVNAVMPTAHTPLLSSHPDAAYRDWISKNFPPEAVAAAIAFLASPAASCSAELFAVAGGMFARVAFQMSRGYLERGLTPESAAAHLEQVFDPADPTTLITQSDLDCVYRRLFPR